MPRNSPRWSNSRNPDLMPATEEFVATGRRKTSVARIRMTPGNGKIDINGRSFEDYFPTVPLQNVVLQPLQTAKAVNAYDLWINASGGGAVGQAGAGQLAVAVCAASDAGELLGFSKRNCCIASPAQKLVRYWVSTVSQMRRASSFRSFAFRMCTCESNAIGAVKLLG